MVLDTYGPNSTKSRSLNQSPKTSSTVSAKYSVPGRRPAVVSSWAPQSVVAPG
jgi:hypothetical protein